jgi:hypothetical protein
MVESQSRRTSGRGLSAVSRRPVREYSVGCLGEPTERALRARGPRQAQVPTSGLVGAQWARHRSLASAITRFSRSTS